MSAHGQHVPAIHHAIIKGLTSLVVGVTIFVALALLRLPPLVGPFVRHIEILGIDLGIYAESFLRFVHPHATGAVQYRYVLFDLDRAACGTLYDDNPACAPTALVDRQVLAKMVRAARDSGALVVVVDIATRWPAPSATDPLAAALAPQPHTGTSLPPVVLPLLADIQPLPADRSDHPVYAIRPMREFSGPAEPAQDTNLYFGLPFGSAGEGGWGGGVVRAYARSLSADALTAGTGPQVYWTLAGAAACLMRHQADVTACRHADPETTAERIHFSVPSMILLPPDDRRLAAIRWRVTHLQASSELADDDRPFAAAPFLRDAIVVISSSRDVRDYHETPLGPMTGAEIVLNAIRSFLEFPPAGDVGPVWSVLGEIPIIACTATVFAAFWWFVSRHHRRNHDQIWYRSLPRVIMHTIGFLAACFIAVGAASFLALLAVLLQSVSRYDIIMPVLVTALEGTVEGMHVLIDAVERAIGHLLAGATRISWRRTTTRAAKES
jgi:hypothetical protein